MFNRTDSRDDAPDPEPVEYECTECGEGYVTDGSDPCPVCGARRRRYAGELVATDGGDSS